jgi:Family of unknown function (DUF5336)
MTYSSGGPGYPSGQQPSTFPPPATQFAKVDEGPSKLPVYLLAAVAILGIAAYLVSFGPLGALGEAGTSVLVLGVVALLLAALFAVVGMLPKQANYTGVVAATTVVGFLLTIWDLVKNAGDIDWGLIAIVVIAALQTVVAIGVLLLDAGIITPPAPRPKYDPYQQFGGGGYYGQQPQLGQPPRPQSFSQPPGYQPYGGYPGGPPGGGFQPHQPHQAGPPTPPTGFPAYSPPPAQSSSTDQPTVEAPTQQVPVQQSSSPSSSESSSPSGPPPE